jgi:hypothetical protein
MNLEGDRVVDHWTRQQSSMIVVFAKILEVRKILATKLWEHAHVLRPLKVKFNVSTIE